MVVREVYIIHRHFGSIVIGQRTDCFFREGVEDNIQLSRSSNQIVCFRKVECIIFIVRICICMEFQGLACITGQLIYNPVTTADISCLGTNHHHIRAVTEPDTTISTKGTTGCNLQTTGNSTQGDPCRKDTSQCTTINTGVEITCTLLRIQLHTFVASADGHLNDFIITTEGMCTGSGTIELVKIVRQTVPTGRFRSAVISRRGPTGKVGIRHRILGVVEPQVVGIGKSVLAYHNLIMFMVNNSRSSDCAVQTLR